MLTPADARHEAERLYSRRFAQWATVSPGREEVLLDLPLRPPTESAALRDPSAVQAWIAQWAAAGEEVVWEPRRWASMGAQRLPVRLRLVGPAAVAGRARRSEHWELARARAAALGDRLPSTPAVRSALARVLPRVVELTRIDADRLLAVLSWLLEHPASGAFIRQLPIRGIDTKWIEQHRGTVSALYLAATGAPDLGLATRPALVRTRFLDAHLAPGGVSDLAAPIADLARLAIAPRHVLVVENLESMLALPALPGVVAVHGKGYAAAVLDQLPWVLGADVVYWGDLDTDGFNILALTRSHVPQTRSVLMDTTTLTDHLDLCVPDPRPRRTFAGHLHPAELDTIAALREAGDVRLEQERIPWEAATAALRLALAGPPAGSVPVPAPVPAPVPVSAPAPRHAPATGGAP